MPRTSPRPATNRNVPSFCEEKICGKPSLAIAASTAEYIDGVSMPGRNAQDRQWGLIFMLGEMARGTGSTLRLAEIPLAWKQP
jgi:hypothetical protein